MNFPRVILRRVIVPLHTHYCWTFALTADRGQCSDFSLLSLMPSSHCTILAWFFTRRQVLINRRQMPNIGGKSVLVHASDNLTVWMIKVAIWCHRRCVADTWEIFGRLNIWSCRRFTILLCEWILTEKYISDNLQSMFFFLKRLMLTLAIYKQCAYIFALEYADQVGYMKMK